MMADPGRQGPGPGESKGVYGHFGSPADDHQREAEHLRRMQERNALAWLMKDGDDHQKGWGLRFVFHAMSCRGKFLFCIGIEGIWF